MKTIFSKTCAVIWIISTMGAVSAIAETPSSKPTLFLQTVTWGDCEHSGLIKEGEFPLGEGCTSSDDIHPTQTQLGSVAQMKIGANGRIDVGVANRSTVYSINFGDDKNAALFKNEMEDPSHHYQIFLTSSRWMAPGNRDTQVDPHSVNLNQIGIKDLDSDDQTEMTMDKFLDKASYRQIYRNLKGFLNKARAVVGLQGRVAETKPSIQREPQFSENIFPAPPAIVGESLSDVSRVSAGAL
jgi:hypothetical protein